MLVSEQHNFISCFVDGSIIEGIDWFMVEKTMINGLEVGRRKISPCNSDVVLPPHGELILVMRMSGEVSTVPAPVNIGGAAVRRRFKRFFCNRILCTHEYCPSVYLMAPPQTAMEVVDDTSQPSSSASKHHQAKHFPNTSSESDLQRYRTSSVWDHAPSLGNVATVSDSFRTKISKQYSTQDNGSAKFFQGALHAPNMGEKVAQVRLS
ncbi:hypothetical protein M8J76_014767 [Diaphorina citri]|nr:hypothetical protein M8J76_014767 [Diaphorina citri]